MVVATTLQSFLMLLKWQVTPIFLDKRRYMQHSDAVDNNLRMIEQMTFKYHLCKLNVSDVINCFSPISGNVRSD